MNFQARALVSALGLGLWAFAHDAHGQSGSATAEQADALLADVARIVAAEEGSGWFVDAEAFRSMRPTLLESVCRAPPPARARAQELLAARAAAGDPRALFARVGEVDATVAAARRAEREQLALQSAIATVDEDCPYWEPPSEEFRGRQMDRDRFTLSLETGGLVQFRQTDGTWTFGGGGYGRLLPGYGFGGDVTLLVGPEFGGGAMLRPRTTPTELVINYVPAIPVVVRFHDVSWHYDLEVAPVALFQADDSNVSFGARFGGGIGVKALRTRGFLPWAGLAVAYERHFSTSSRPSAHFMRGGLRVGFMWDP